MNNFRRVLLKLSGESLMGAKQYGIDNDRLADYAQDIEAAVKRGIQVAIVIGGGNIFRGLSGAAQRASTVYKATKWVCWPPSSIA